MFSLIWGGGGIIFADRWKNRKNPKKIQPATISCHTVSLVYLNFFSFCCQLVSIFEENNKKVVPFVGEKLQRISNFL